MPTATSRKTKDPDDNLDLNDPLPEKWLKYKDLPSVRIGRKLVQNYYTGRIRLMRDASAAKATSPINIEIKGMPLKIVPPIWRNLSNSEGDRLWNIENYRSYYNNRRVYHRSEYSRQHGVVLNNGGVVKDIDLLEDEKLLKKAQNANRAAQARDRSAKLARSYATRTETIDKYLFEMARTFRSERNAQFVRNKEKHILDEEYARETARRMIREETTPRTGGSSGSGPSRAIL